MKTFFEGLDSTKKIISDNKDIFDSILNNYDIWNDLNKFNNIQKNGYTVKDKYIKSIECKNIILDNKIADLAESNLVIAEKDFNNIYYKISNDDFNNYCSIGYNGNVSYDFDYIWFFKYNNQDYFIKGSDKSIFVTNESINKQDLIRIINDKKKLDKKYEKNYQDYFIDKLVGDRFKIINLIDLIKIIGEYKNIKDQIQNYLYDVFIKKVNDLNVKYNEWIISQADQSIFNKNPFINLSSDFFNKIKEKLSNVPNVVDGLKIKEQIKNNDPSVFNDIKINNLIIDDENKRDLISKINVNIQNFYKNNQINDGIQLMINIINYIKKDNTMNDIYMRFLNILVKLPHDLYLKINNIDNDNIKYLCNNFGNWLKICSNSPLINIFKYSYYLLINKLFNIDLIHEVKNNILEEFILDVDQYVLTDLQLISVIKEIKDKLNEVKIWYWDNDSFNVILEKISELIKNGDNNKLLTTGDLNYNFDSNISGIDFKYFEQGSDYVFTNPDQKTDNKVPPLLIENSALCFKFPNLEIRNFDITSVLNKVLILLQMINCLKLSVPFENNYPKELPFIKNNISLCFEQNLDNILYKANYEIKEKNILNAKKELTNEFNTIKYIENVENPSVNFEYINNFINFIDSGNQDYLYSKINPFIKYGLELLENNNFEPVNYNNSITIIGEESFTEKKFFQLKNNIYELLKSNNENICTINLELFKSLDPIPANLYLFIYLYICEKSYNFIEQNKDIIKNKLKSFDDIQKLDETFQLMCLSNNIKIKVIEEVYDEEFYKSIEEILKNNVILQKVDNNDVIINDTIDFNKSIDLINIVGKSIEFECIEYLIPYINFVGSHSRGPFQDKQTYKDRNKSFDVLINLLIQNQFKYDKKTKKTLPALCYGLWDENNAGKVNEKKFNEVMNILFGSNYGNQSFNTVAKLIDADWKIIPNINDINNATIRYLIGSDTMDKLNIKKDNFRPTVETANNINLEDYEKLPLNPNMKAYISTLVNQIKNPSTSSISSTGRPTGASSSSSTGQPSGAGTSSSRPILKIEPTSNEKTGSSNSQDKINIDRTGNKNFKITKEEKNPSSIENIRLTEGLKINIDFSNDTMNLKRGNFTINKTPITNKVVINDLLSKIENKQIEVEQVQEGGKSKTRSNFDSDSDSDIIFDSDTDSFLDSDTDFSFDSDSDTDIILDKKFMKMKGGQEIKLTDYFYNQYITTDNNNIKKIITMLPCLTKTNNNQEKEYVYTYRNMIVHNLYYFISLLNKDVHYDSNFGQLYNFNNKFNSEVYEFNNIDDPIKRVYLSRELDGFRNIFVYGKDMFQIYKSNNGINEDLLNIYNKGPFIDTRDNIRNEFSQKLQNIIDKQIKLTKKIYISGENLVLNDIDQKETPFFINDKKQQEYLDMIKKYNYNNKLVNEGYNFNFNEKNIHITGNLEYIENLVFKGKYDCSTTEIIFETPVYLSNPIFYDSKYFKYVQINNKSNNGEVGEIIAIAENTIYKNNKLKLIVKNNTYSIVNKYGNTYVDISEIMENDLYNKIIGMTKEKNCILCWKNNSNQIITVDIIDIKLNLTIDYDNNNNLSILYNNLYKIILNFESVDWNVKKWVNTNKILLTQENNNPNGKYYLILLREDSNILIELNQNTFLPVINDKKTLEYFINELVLNDKGKILLKELIPLIVKFGIEYNNNSSINDYVNKYIDNSIIGSSIVYNIKYNYLEINDLLIDKYYEKYYCPGNNRYFVSFSEYMLYSLSSEEKIVYLENDNELKEVVLRDLAFSIFYNKLISNHNIKWGDAPEVPYIFNPLELYYQYIFGSFASKEQLDLAEAIFQDSVQKKINCPVMTGGYNENIPYRLSYYFNIKPECYMDVRENPKIHNLIMGSGKTKVITPLVILKYLQYLTTLPADYPKQHCYLILPENLVNQSFEHLKSYLDMYFPILVNKCFEKRGMIESNDFKTYLNTLQNEDEKSKTYLDVYVLSDTSLKCGFLNDYNLVNNNKNNHIYLFDEADTILNPLISELNYPDGNEVSIENISEWFSIIYCSFRKIYINNDELKSDTFRGILNKFPNDWSYQPHFYIINPKPEFIKEIKEWIKNSFKTYFKKKDLVIYDLFSDLNIDNLINNKDITEGKKISILNLLYVLNNIIDSVLPTVFSMINRVNFGVHELKITKNECLYVAIPFNYNEDPSLGSKFSNPLLTICLTMVDYILSTKENSIKTLSNNNLNKLFELMIKEYNSIPDIYRKNSIIYEAFLSIFDYDPRFNIKELTNISMLNNDEIKIKKLRMNEYLIYILCKDQCSKLKIDLNRDSISGFDLFMSFNLKNRVGFTGTSNIPKVIDLNKNEQIDILSNDKELNKINNALTNFTSIYTTKKNEYNSNYDLIEEVIKSNNEINTLIDVGGVFVGLNPIGIFEVIKKHVLEQNDNKIPEGFQFIYFGELNGESDVKITVDEYGNQQKWSEIISSNIYYYFDQRHTTGTDAKIPNNSIGAAFLNKNSRWRDIVQSVYRMRGFGKSDENPTEIYNINHSIIFVINEQLKELINVTVNNNQIDEKNKLLEWFNILEKKSKDNQMALARIQNIKSLSRPGRSENNKFKSVNDFMFFDLNNLRNISSDEIKNIILGNKSWEDQEIEEFIKKININNNKVEIENLINEYEKSNHMLINQLESTSQIQVQVKEQVQSQVINIESEAIKQKPKIELNKLDTTHIFKLEDYFNYSRNTNYYDMIIDECLYVSVNFNVYNNKDRDSSHVIYIDDKLLMIPNTEGFKLIDYLKENVLAIDNEYIIFDTKGTVYLTKGSKDSEIINQLSLIKSYVKLMFSVYFNNYITMDDYINVMILLKLFKLKGKDNLIELIKSNILKIENSIIVNYIKCLDEYLRLSINELELLNKNQTIINFFTFDGKYRNEGNNYLQIFTEINNKFLKK